MHFVRRHAAGPFEHDLAAFEGDGKSEWPDTGFYIHKHTGGGDGVGGMVYLGPCAHGVSKDWDPEP